jgi:hypothetical protein
MRTADSPVPASIAEALRMASASMDYLNSPAAQLDGAACGPVLAALGQIQAKFTAAHAQFLRRFDAAGGHDGDGYGTTSAWLAAMTQMTTRDARREVRQMRRHTAHRHLTDAMAAGQLSTSWARQIAAWTDQLPAPMRAGTDQILAGAAAAGAGLQDLATLAARVFQTWRSQQPDPDGDDGFDDRYVQVGTTFGGAGCIGGNLTPECAAAITAVLDALGKRQGPEDHRTQGQRFHDALQLGCELLIRANMIPDRAGADTHVTVHIPLSALRQLPGASRLEEAWIAARLGEPGYLTGAGAQAAACDALIIPAVTGQADMTIIDRMIDLAVAYAHHAGRDTGGTDAEPGAGQTTGDRPGFSPEAYAALRYSIARLAVDFLSGPDGLGSVLRSKLLDPPYNTPSLPLDIGYSENIPAHIRRAVQLRDKRCAWPRCGRPAAYCDVHHVNHKKHGGKTSVDSCVLLCQFHHDVCIHRWGWQITLHPDGSTEARGPHGQILRSHAPPPTLRAG